jgi:hypothetical protein
MQSDDDNYITLVNISNIKYIVKLTYSILKTNSFKNTFPIIQRNNLQNSSP